jgi:hypothetical protein
MKIAILLSGHIRSYTKTRQNIFTNLIEPLKKSGNECLIFSSIWSNCGFRENDWIRGEFNENQLREDSCKFEIEDNKRDEFLSKYSNDKWKNYSHLSGPETCGDAVSMWYKISKCFKLVTDNDIDVIFRLRPDMHFDKEFDTTLLDFIQENTIYMPIWHGKFEEVTCKMMDHFAFGSFDSMKIYCNLYDSIGDIINRNDFPFTAEGFLYSHIKHNNINIMRCNINYGVLRSHGIEKVL